MIFRVGPGRRPVSTIIVCAPFKGVSEGEHGLPLIGSGDWNDGMNMVGREGKGESVWLAFFMCEVLGRFSWIARPR